MANRDFNRIERTIKDFSQNVEAEGSGAKEYQEGEGIKIANDTISIDDTVVAKKSEIPTIPTDVSAFNNDAGYITGISTEDIIDALGYTPGTSDFSGDYNDLENKPDLSGYAQKAELAEVATSGSYNDLSNTPDIPDAVVANPVLSGDEAELTGLQVGETKYKVGGSADLGLRFQPVEKVLEPMIIAFKETNDGSIVYLDSRKLYQLLLANGFSEDEGITSVEMCFIFNGQYVDAESSGGLMGFFDGFQIRFTGSSNLEVLIEQIWNYYMDTIIIPEGIFTPSMTLQEFFEYLIENNINIPISKYEGGQYSSIFGTTFIPNFIESYVNSSLNAACPLFGSVILMNKGLSSADENTACINIDPDGFKDLLLIPEV